MTDPIFDVSGAVAVLNQTLEFAYPTITVIGELANFKVSKGRWVYADLKDDVSKLRMFGTVFQMPGPLEDGMMLEVIAEPRLHPQFGFSLYIKSLRPVGEGSIKKAADLLREKLDKEGLFAVERKRAVPHAPSRIGLITSEQSAAYSDFIKILNNRWQGVEIEVFNAQVQGEAAIESIVSGLLYFNQVSEPPEVVVVTRGGGSADDLSAFNSEQVTRAVSASRVVTVVAIGHEIDISLAELAADLRASTPSNAAEMLFPDRHEVSNKLRLLKNNLTDVINQKLDLKSANITEIKSMLLHRVETVLERRSQELHHSKSLLESIHPKSALKRGYALVKKNNKLVSSVKQLSKGSELDIMFYDGNVQAEVQ
jgi:exodeoxyribonuclease VII large subunit